MIKLRFWRQQQQRCDMNDPRRYLDRLEEDFQRTMTELERDAGPERRAEIDAWRNRHAEELAESVMDANGIY